MPMSTLWGYCGGERGVSSWGSSFEICFTRWSLFMDTFCGVHQQREGMELATLCTRVFVCLLFFVSKKIYYESLNIRLQGFNRSRAHRRCTPPENQTRNEPKPKHRSWEQYLNIRWNNSNKQENLRPKETNRKDKAKTKKPPKQGFVCLFYYRVDFFIGWVFTNFFCLQTNDNVQLSNYFH